MHAVKPVQVALVICGLLSPKSYSHWKNSFKNVYFLVKIELFIYKFKIRSLKFWNVSTANNEGNLYKNHQQRAKTWLI